MPKVVISIVTWNSMRFLPDALASIEAQTYPDISLVAVDNASTDGSAEHVRANFPRAAVLRNTRNLGFSRAHNQAIEYARANLCPDDGALFVLVMNPDVILTADFVEKLMDRVAHRTDVASACGKTLRVHHTYDGEMRGYELTDVIDSTGISMSRSRLVADRRSGERDSGAFERTDEVFGPSGCLALYRVAALEDAAARGEYFDEDFFAYKEDADLAWRLRLRGWKSLYVPNAVAYHYRRIAGNEKSSVLGKIRARRGRSRAVSRYSYRNHLLMLLKNERAGDFLRDLPFIAVEECGKFFYALFFEPATLLAIKDVAVRLPRYIAKRRAVMSGRRCMSAELRSWLGGR